MLGQTLVGSRLRDVRSVLRYLRTRADLDAGRVALWGDSFAPANPEGRTLAVPLDADPFPHQAEPLGGLLALFTALFEDDVRAVYVRGGLTGFESLLQSPVLLRPARRLDPRSPDGGRPVRRGGGAGASAVAHGGPGRRARPCGRARRDGQDHGAGPIGIPGAGRRDQTPARRGRCGQPSGRPLAPGDAARGTRPEAGPVSASDVYGPMRSRPPGSA